MRHLVRALAAVAALALTSCGLLVAPRAYAEPGPGGVTHAENPRVIEGAEWSEAYFASKAPSLNGDAVELHADVLRPVGLAPDQPTPVIMSVGPYFAHEASEPYYFEHTGPSPYWYDFVAGAKLMERGYTFVMVDLRGYGGSTGCIDMMGDGEQADVASAVEWAAAQPWSNGAVGLYGQSYDATTALAGVNLAPAGLAAAVAQEPIWSMREIPYPGGVPQSDVVSWPRQYYEESLLGGYENPYGDIPADTDRYLSNAAYEKTRPECERAMREAFVENKSRGAPFWAERDLADRVNGSKVPLFITQGFLDERTKPDEMDTYLAKHDGPQRAWLGPWGHTTGDASGETDEGILAYAMGRSTWFAEVMDFYDRYLRGAPPAAEEDQFLIQDNSGRWRGQDAWPVATVREIELSGGSYLDIGEGNSSTNPFIDDPFADPFANPGDGDPDSDGSGDDPGPADDYFVISKPVTDEVRITGSPKINLQTASQRNVWARLWDVDERGKGVLITQQAGLLDPSGRTELKLLSTDWKLAAGRRLAVSFGTITDETPLWPTPSREKVTIDSAALNLPLAPTLGEERVEGEPAPALGTWLNYSVRQFALADVPPSFEVSLVPEPTPPSPSAPASPTVPTPGSPTPSATAAPSEQSPSTDPSGDPGVHPRPPAPPLAETGGPALGFGLLGVVAALAGAAMIRRR